MERQGGFPDTPQDPRGRPRAKDNSSSTRPRDPRAPRVAIEPESRDPNYRYQDNRRPEERTGQITNHSFDPRDPRSHQRIPTAEAPTYHNIRHTEGNHQHVTIPHGQNIEGWTTARDPGNRQRVTIPHSRDNEGWITERDPRDQGWAESPEKPIHRHRDSQDPRNPRSHSQSYDPRTAQPQDPRVSQPRHETYDQRDPLLNAPSRATHSNDSRNAEDPKIAHARQVPYHSGYQTPNQDPRYSNVDNSRSQGLQQYPSETVHKGRWFDAELQVNFFLSIFFSTFSAFARSFGYFNERIGSKILFWLFKCGRAAKTVA